MIGSKTIGLRILLITLFTGCSLFVCAQDINKLKEDIRRAEEEIKINTELLNKTRSERNVNLSQLKLIQSRIQSRKKIVTALEKQAQLINSDISYKNSNINSLQKEYSKLQKEYGELIYSSYKNYKLNNYLLFLFASKDFNDATKRIAFMRRYNQMKESKANEIETLAGKLSNEITELSSKKNELDQTKVAKTNEIKTLGKDESQYSKTVSQLKSQEGKLNKELRAKRAQIDRAQQQIQRIIAEESRKSKNKKRTVAEEQEMVAISGKFDQNLGKLPYPVRGGVIVDHFGIHAHPTINGLKVNNKGVNIAGESGASVYCIFEGEVSRIIFLPGLNNSVMVRHGSYITVYSNLTSVSIKPGEKVSLNQKIGNLATSDNSDDCVLHFEIWKESTNMNPENFLRR